MTTKRKAYVAHSLSELRRLYASGIDATLAPAAEPFLKEKGCNDQPLKPTDGSNEKTNSDAAADSSDGV